MSQADALASITAAINVLADHARKMKRMTRDVEAKLTTLENRLSTIDTRMQEMDLVLGDVRSILVSALGAEAEEDGDSKYEPGSDEDDDSGSSSGSSSSSSSGSGASSESDASVESVAPPAKKRSATGTATTTAETQTKRTKNGSPKESTPPELAAQIVTAIRRAEIEPGKYTYMVTVGDREMDVSDALESDAGAIVARVLEETRASPWSTNASTLVQRRMHNAARGITGRVYETTPRLMRFERNSKCIRTCSRHRCTHPDEFFAHDSGPCIFTDPETPNEDDE